MSDFKTTVTLSQDSVRIMKEQGYSLYGFKAVKASASGGAPTVWFRLQKMNLATNNVISWVESYQGYASTSQILPNLKIDSSNTVNTSLGNKIEIEKGSGNLIDTTVGIEGSVSFINNNSMQYTVGLNQKVNGERNPLCAFPILGTGSARVITPITKIALIFSTREISTSTVITKAMSQGAFIDLTGKGNNERTLHFDVNDGWSALGNPGWLKTFHAFCDLRSLLITTTDS
ncbi:hypothetical protein [uncultured Kordia sp.]|uniref:hypothetical protein n=1 Tax=uncultured Kordia sp. TaxID=507699 RepID=UPI0026373C41|nr:hypothetical protein [uncultured Kordia sp.]